MDISKLILDNREEKNRFIQTLTNNYQVITLKANIPGINKNTNEVIYKQNENSPKHQRVY